MNAPIVLRSGQAEFTLHPHIGMLGTSFRVNGVELLAMPKSVNQYLEGSCTGMPLLHPFANRLSECSYAVPERGTSIDFETDLLHLDSSGLPIHGFIYGKPFDVVAQTLSSITARCDMNFADNVTASYPFEHRITVHLELGTFGVEHRLAVTTVVENTGSTMLPISFGWHPFFSLASTERARWILRTPACEQHLLDEFLIPTGVTIPHPEIDAPIDERTYDDHFSLADDRTFVLRDDTSTLVITFDDGYSNLQMYVPPEDGMRPTSFVCIEPMTAATNALVAGTAPLIAPGERYEATFTIAAVVGLGSSHI